MNINFVSTCTRSTKLIHVIESQTTMNCTYSSYIRLVRELCQFLPVAGASKSVTLCTHRHIYRVHTSVWRCIVLGSQQLDPPDTHTHTNTLRHTNKDYCNSNFSNEIRSFVLSLILLFHSLLIILGFWSSNRLFLLDNAHDCTRKENVHLQFGIDRMCVSAWTWNIWNGYEL